MASILSSCLLFSFLLFCLLFSSSLIELEICFKKPRGDQRSEVILFDLMLGKRSGYSEHVLESLVITLLWNMWLHLWRGIGWEGEEVRDEGGRERMRMAMRVWAKCGLFSLLHFLLASCFSPAIFLSPPRCSSASLARSLKETSTALIVTFSNVYVLLSFALLSSLLPPRYLTTLRVTSYFHSPSSFSHHLFIILCCCSDIHTLLRRSWPSMASTSMSPLHFILYSSFFF